MIRLQPARGAAVVKVTFVLDQTAPAGPVSVVGSFNAWDPLAHPLRKRSNGTRSAAVTLPAGQDVRFRYLASDGVWFDDPDASDHDAEGGVLHL